MRERECESAIESGERVCAISVRAPTNTIGWLAGWLGRSELSLVEPGGQLYGTSELAAASKDDRELFLQSNNLLASHFNCLAHTHNSNGVRAAGWLAGEGKS